MSEGIQLPALRELCRAGAVREVLVIAIADGGFAIRARYGMVERTLMTQRGQVRAFASLDTVAEVVRCDLQLGRLSVELADFVPRR